MVDRGMGRHAVFTTLALHSWFVAAVLRSRSAGYDYRIGSDQGRAGPGLRVIGDNMGGRTLDRLARDPELLARVEDLVQVPVRLIHVSRNPFDSIATMYNRSRAGRGAAPASGARRPVERVLERRVRRYLQRAGAIEALAADGVPFLTVRHEALVQAPEKTLGTILEHLGLTAPPGYLERCAARTLTKVRRTRYSIHWPTDLRKMVERATSAVTHLRGYSFDA